MAKSVSFEYINGSSRPSQSLEVESAEAAYGVIGRFLQPFGGWKVFVPGTIRYQESLKLPDPPTAEGAMLERAMRASDQQNLPFKPVQELEPFPPGL